VTIGREAVAIGPDRHRWRTHHLTLDLICAWLMAQRLHATEEIARRLQHETGCVLYDAARREIVTLEQLANW
jgi:hypothetical protein